MSETLPRLRMNLDFMPSADSRQPGLVIRDPYHYSDAVLVVPTVLIPCLDYFDGDHTELDLRSEIVRRTGQIQVGDIERNLVESLDTAGFFENDTYRAMRRKREQEFAEEPFREAIFAGSAYPARDRDIKEEFEKEIGAAQGRSSTTAIAAPHASPDGGWRTYRAAYNAALSMEEAADRVFVILGTSHYGAPDRFGLTRKNFRSPLGEAVTATSLVDELEEKAPSAIRMEDYCHAVEHSIEFQTILLQYLYGPRVRILPILCGPFVRSIYEGGLPEQDENVQRFFDALGEIGSREGKKLFWVLGVDMAHMGMRYGDPAPYMANSGEMLEIAEQDRMRMEQIAEGNREGYWEMIQRDGDPLKWCGASPFYTFLKAMPNQRGEILDYHHWQIDPKSVVSFAALRFGS